MRLETEKVILTEGTIKRIRFSDSKDSAFIDLSDGTEVEFRNTKTPRADDVLKKRLNVGEHIICSGQKVSNAHGYIFGYGIERNGKVSDGLFSIIKGTVNKIVKNKYCSIVSIEYAGKVSPLKLSDCIFPDGLKTGDSLVCSCKKFSKYECVSPCNSISIKKCTACHGKNPMVGTDVLQAKIC